MPYYMATFVGLSLIVAVIKFWAWVEDRHNSALLAVEERIITMVAKAFADHALFDKERTARLEAKIDTVCLADRARRAGTPIPFIPGCGIGGTEHQEK